MLSIIDWYLPGFKAGGPIRSLANTVDVLKDEYEFFIFTRDRDLGDIQPFSGVPLDSWTAVRGAKVFYATHFSSRSLIRRIAETTPHLIHLNSFFSRLTLRVLMLRRIRLITQPVVVAPRGEFSQGALALKARVKKLYLTVAVRFLLRGVTWQASTSEERQRIAEVLAQNGDNKTPKIVVARDPVSNPKNLSRGRAKQPGKVRLIFLSRISPMKNLMHAVASCEQLQGEVSFDIYGPAEDPRYMDECLRAIKNVPNNIKIVLKGAVSPDRVQRIFSYYHFMILPTLGENFGHVILEALAAGTPVLISDKTPWSGLETQNAGWALPLELERWRRTLATCVQMPDEQYQRMSHSARRFAINAASAPSVRAEHANLFKQAFLIQSSCADTSQVGTKQPALERATTLEQQTGDMK